mmetsp:Transcript_36352/g.43989  ORF Transcript_36352/g.43989 Transcript_36352/m.43989 type:complete len:117 (+) Transcript_36352:384-734(+)
MSKTVTPSIIYLYRQVLRSHRLLPAPMRSLGDRYARDEFRRHRESETTPEQWTEFAVQWRKYISTIRGDVGATSTGNLSHDDLENMSPQQLDQLTRLRSESLRIGSDLDLGEIKKP